MVWDSLCAWRSIWKLPGYNHLMLHGNVMGHQFTFHLRHIRPPWLHFVTLVKEFRFSRSNSRHPRFPENPSPKENPDLFAHRLFTPSLETNYPIKKRWLHLCVRVITFHDIHPLRGSVRSVLTCQINAIMPRSPISTRKITSKAEDANKIETLTHEADLN